METLISIKNLSIGIHYPLPGGGEKTLSAVEDLSFNIYPGEILGLVGESGAGKSLTALSIAGLLGEGKEVTSGSIIYSSGISSYDILKQDERELRKIRGKEISFIFQEPVSSLNPLLKIGAQIAETLELHGEKDKTSNKAKVKELMEKLKLPPELESSYPNELSGGMCQRVMIALAIICRPRLLIADEPVTALDFNTQIQILSLLKEINRDFQTSLLFISHDLSAVKDICGRMLVMYSGRILEEGQTVEIFNHPSHEYTKGLLASLPGRASRGKDLAVIPGKIPSLEEGRPRGCPFHPRCGKALPDCKNKFPAERQLGANHKTHCVLEEMR